MIAAAARRSITENNINRITEKYIIVPVVLWFSRHPVICYRNIFALTVPCFLAFAARTNLKSPDFPLNGVRVRTYDAIIRPKTVN